MFCLLGELIYHYVMPYFISNNFSSFKVSSVWNLYSHSCFLLTVSTACFSPFPFSPYASLYLKWVSYSRHRVGSCFLIHCDSPCLLIGVFRTSTFKVIVDMVGLTSTVFATVFCLLPLFFDSIFVFRSFPDFFFCGFHWAFCTISFSFLS